MISNSLSVSDSQCIGSTAHVVDVWLPMQSRAIWRRSSTAMLHACDLLPVHLPSSASELLNDAYYRPLSILY